MRKTIILLLFFLYFCLPGQAQAPRAPVTEIWDGAGLVGPDHFAVLSRLKITRKKEGIIDCQMVVSVPDEGYKTCQLNFSVRLVNNGGETSGLTAVNDSLCSYNINYPWKRVIENYLRTISLTFNNKAGVPLLVVTLKGPETPSPAPLFFRRSRVDGLIVSRAIADVDYSKWAKDKVPADASEQGWMTFLSLSLRKRFLTGSATLRYFPLHQLAILEIPNIMPCPFYLTSSEFAGLAKNSSLKLEKAMLEADTNGDDSTFNYISLINCRIAGSGDKPLCYPSMDIFDRNMQFVKDRYPGLNDPATDDHRLSIIVSEVAGY